MKKTTMAMRQMTAITPRTIMMIAGASTYVPDASSDSCWLKRADAGESVSGERGARRSDVLDDADAGAAAARA